MEIKLLSAGAVQPGLTKVLDAFRKEFNHEVKVTFATAPALRKQLGEGAQADVVIAPSDVIGDLIITGKARREDRAIVGRIGIGVAVQASAPGPKISTVEELKQSLLNAQSIVYNQASTGIYLEKLFDRLGISEQLKSKTTRYPDFAAVRDHLSKGKDNEIGFGATTVIAESAGKGLKFVGPLPVEIQNYTTYEAAVSAESGSKEAAVTLLHYFGSPKAKVLLKTAGIE